MSDIQNNKNHIFHNIYLVSLLISAIFMPLFFPHSIFILTRTQPIIKVLFWVLNFCFCTFSFITLLKKHKIGFKVQNITSNIGIFLGTISILYGIFNTYGALVIDNTSDKNMIVVMPGIISLILGTFAVVFYGIAKKYYKKYKQNHFVEQQNIQVIAESKTSEKMVFNIIYSIFIIIMPIISLWFCMEMIDLMKIATFAGLFRYSCFCTVLSTLTSRKLLERDKTGYKMQPYATSSGIVMMLYMSYFLEMVDEFLLIFTIIPIIIYVIGIVYYAKNEDRYLNNRVL